MPYITPTFNTLLNDAKNLASNYSGKNEERIKLIKLIQFVASKCDTSDKKDILVGVFIFAQECISAEYNYANSELGSWGIFQSGSELKKILSVNLDIKKNNKPDHCQKIIYLVALYQFAKLLDLNEVISGYELSNPAFCKDILKQISKLINVSQPEITELLEKRPNAVYLEQVFSQISIKYKAAKQENYAAHELIHFLEFTKHKLERFKESAQDKAYADTIRYAAVVYVMFMIENKYKLLSPERSELYKICQETINLQKTELLSPLEKTIYYSALDSFIPKINPLYPESYESQHASFPNAGKFFSRMHRNLLEQELLAYDIQENFDPFPKLNNLRNLINLTTQYSIHIVIGTFAGGLVSLPVNQQFLTRGLGVLGKSYYGFPGAIIGKQIGTAIEQTAITSIIGSSLKKIANTVTNTPGNVVYYTLYVPAKVADHLTKLMASPLPEKTHETIRFVSALLALPNEILDETKKTKLRYIQLFDSVAEVEKPMPEMELHRANSR